MINIGLIGKPNCGKTTLFNKLTGRCENTGNWSGVTVKDVKGCDKDKSRKFNFIDFPGIYSLTQLSDSAEDERNTIDNLLSNQLDLIINVVDASSLERHLYLTSQLLEAGFKVIVVLNMMDIVRNNRERINIKELSKKLKCPVIALVAHKDEGFSVLLDVLSKHESIDVAAGFVDYPSEISNIQDKLRTQCINKTMIKIPIATQILWWLEGDTRTMPSDISALVASYQCQIQAVLSEDPDIIIIDARYRAIEDITSSVRFRNHNKSNLLEHIDNIVMHKYLGIPIFLSVMYSMFVVSINVGGLIQDFFDSIVSIYFIGNGNVLLNSIGAPSIVTSIIATGVGQGINTVLSFVPIIGCIFFCLSFLEGSGYMARATFVLDRLIKFIGLPSKSFMPLIIGFGCNVPSIMATRSISNPSDRIVTAMMSPFLSCSARLAVYSVFVSVFFKSGGHNVIFMLYLLGIVCALTTGYILKKHLSDEPSTSLISEFPSYRMPSFALIWSYTYRRISSFIKNAGKYILLTCIVLSILSDHTFASLFVQDQSTSLLEIIGRFATPIFSPMGIVAENWPATVGLLTGALAKEAVLGTLNTLYSTQGVVLEQFIGFAGLSDTFGIFWNRLLSLPGSIFTPMLVSDEMTVVHSQMRESLANNFHSTSSVISYLILLSLYIPCISTVVVIGQELNKFWMSISVAWSMLLGYGLAVLYYQIANFGIHPYQSTFWIISIIVVFTSSLLGFKLLATRGHLSQQLELSGGV